MSGARVDVHTHTPAFRDSVPTDQEVWNTVFRPDRPTKVTVSWADHDRAMADGGIAIAVAFNIAGAPAGRGESVPVAQAPNDETAAFVAAAPHRRIGFMSVHPEAPDVLDEIARCAEDLGLVGIKLAANYQRFDPLGDAAFRVYAEAERRGLPILFHQGATPRQFAPLHYAHPLTIDQVAMAHPELRVVMAHMGHPWQTDTALVVRKHPNVYADLSGQFYRPMGFYLGMCAAMEWGVLDKILFGSDYPIVSPAETRTALLSVNEIVRGTGLPVIPDDALLAILQRDPLPLLGLEAPAASS